MSEEKNVNEIEDEKENENRLIKEWEINKINTKEVKFGIVWYKVTLLKKKYLKIKINRNKILT